MKIGKQAQYIALNTEIERDHVKLGRTSRQDGLAFRPQTTLVPLVGLCNRDELCQIHPLETWKLLRLGERLIRIRLVVSDDATGLRTLIPDQARQFARVDVRDRHGTATLEETRERCLRAPVADRQRKIPDDQASRVDRLGLEVIGGCADITDMGIGQGHELTKIRRVGKDLLISRHRSVEHHFAERPAGNANGQAVEDRPVLER